MSIFQLSMRSMKNRALSTNFTIASIALSVCLLIGVDRVKDGMRQSFESTISGTDLIVGPRGGDIPLMLMAIFNIGYPSHQISWPTYEFLQHQNEVAWHVPLSVGDSHHGYRVIGTSEDYFKHVKFADNRSHEFAEGRAFRTGENLEAVLGADVAKELGYKLGAKLVLEHGLEHEAIHSHEDQPFTVVGILARSGTPADRTILVSLDGITAIHADWHDGVPMDGDEDGHDHEDDYADVEAHTHHHEHEHEDDEHHHNHDEEEPSVSAVLLGLKSPNFALQLQRSLNEYHEEPLSALIPGLVLGELWQLAGIGERALIFIGIIVVFAAILGMIAAVLTSLNERRREIAVLRALGAPPYLVVASLALESLILGALGFIFGLILVNGGLLVFKYLNGFGLGIYIGGPALNTYDLIVFVCILSGSFVAGLIPAFKAYTQSLVDGLTVQY